MGVRGQDGYFLAKWLRENGYEVIGLSRAAGAGDVAGFLDRYIQMDLASPHGLEALIEGLQPDEMYYLAAHHFSSEGPRTPEHSIEPYLSVNLRSPALLLEGVALSQSKTKMFFASSCHVFGTPAECPQSEATPIAPRHPYAITKAAMSRLCGYYREEHGVHASVGILYNHESHRRPLDFVSRKIINAVATAKKGSRLELSVIDPDAVVDWGAARIYVRAMWLMLQAETPDDFIIASGRGHTVREFAEVASELSGVSLQLPRSSESTAGRTPYIGDPRKIRESLGWEAGLSLRELAAELYESELKLIRES